MGRTYQSFALLLSTLVLSCLGGCGGSSTGTVFPTANPLVASYSISVGDGEQVKVEFGKDTSYGLTTSVQSTQYAGPVNVFVAGMQQNTLYHMRAVVTSPDGRSRNDVDHTFQTGAIPSGRLPTLTAQTTAGMTPQPGIEMINPVLGSFSTAFATDLEGNIIWYYAFPDSSQYSQVAPIKLLANGHFGIFLGANTQVVPLTQQSPQPILALREIDLAGNTIQQLTMSSLNTSLAAAGFNLTGILFSHDFVVLPNGHWLVIVTNVRNYTNLPGYPGTIGVTGDAVIDLDQNMQPVWVWNSFDHLDINRHPYMFPDWTHSNSIVYSPDDGDFVISMRHQNWVLKVDYRDGMGTGNIVWHLGEGGDFKLLNGVDPTDWFYAQHYATFLSPNSTGVFTMGVLDDGDDRTFPTGVVCNSAGAPPCLYSTVPIMQINDHEMTASFLFHQILPTSLYTYFGGNTEVLANNNVEYCLSGVGADSYIFEVTQQSSPQTVWEMHLTRSNAYRGLRMPSLYPGVQW